MHFEKFATNTLQKHGLSSKLKETVGVVSESISEHYNSGNWDSEASLHRIQIPSTPVGTQHVTGLQSSTPELSNSFPKQCLTSS